MVNIGDGVYSHIDPIKLFKMREFDMARVCGEGTHGRVRACLQYHLT